MTCPSDPQSAKGRVRNLITGERNTGRTAEVVRVGQPQSIRVGTLPYARAAFEKAVGIELPSWSEPSDVTNDVVVPFRDTAYVPSPPDVQDDVPFE
jgi:hypothetical protein